MSTEEEFVTVGDVAEHAEICGFELVNLDGTYGLWCRRLHTIAVGTLEELDEVLTAAEEFDNLVERLLAPTGATIH